MRLGVFGHSIAIRTNFQTRQEHNPELDTWPGWIEIIESEGYDCVSTGVYHMSTERAAFQIPRKWEADEIDCAVVFWAIPHYYWLPEVPARDFSYYPSSIRREKIAGARGVRHGTDFDDAAVAGTSINLKRLIQANMYYQEFHNKDHLIWRHENALLRLEMQCRARRIPIVHYFHPGTRVPDWLEVISGPVDFYQVGSMQDQRAYSANFRNCDNRLNREGNQEMARRVKRDVARAVDGWYERDEAERINDYVSLRKDFKKREVAIWRKLDLDLHESAKLQMRKSHNKGAGARPSNRPLTNPNAQPVLSDKEIKRLRKASKRK